MAGYSKSCSWRKPPQPHPDDEPSLPSIQNSPDWPSTKMQSLRQGSSPRTLNESDEGTSRYRHDVSTLRNVSCEDLDSDRGSVFPTNISTSPLSSLPSTPKRRPHDQYQALLSERLRASFRQSSSSIRADKHPDQPGLSILVPSSPKSTIESTNTVKDYSSHHDIVSSMSIDSFDEDIPRRSVFTDIASDSSRSSIPNGAR
jgi:hypothetical protein